MAEGTLLKRIKAADKLAGIIDRQGRIQTRTYEPNKKGIDIEMASAAFAEVIGFWLCKDNPDLLELYLRVICEQSRRSWQHHRQRLGIDKPAEVAVDPSPPLGGFADCGMEQPGSSIGS